MAIPQFQTVVNKAGTRLTLAEAGDFEIAISRPQWRFAGNIGSALSGLTAKHGEDRGGAYRAATFDFTSPEGAARRGSIRLYEQRNIVLFEVTFIDGGNTRESFPSLVTYPGNLHHLSYTSTFGGFSFRRLGPDGPWIFFDDGGSAFILSPASHFLNARLSTGPHGELRSGIVARNRRIPAGFVHSTALVFAEGVNRCFETWGRFLTDSVGTERPPNDADIGLRTLGYWTDRGANYYYHVAPGLNYPQTLLGVRDNFRQANIPLGYMQLDSWFYPKGHEARWRSADRLGGGVSTYEAAKEVFPQGLKSFQKQLGLPLITHGRWIDRSSPYRKTYAMSGNVSIDPGLWAEWMRRLREAGVFTYEQDWLSGPASAERKLETAERFFDLMAEAARKEGLSLQYCMPLPRHFLQGARYANLTTIRTSADRFGKNRWKAFLFNGRLATALGKWPWTDVFMSTERSNLLIATLSGGMVGVGDAIGELDRTNLLRAVRADGVIIKPDAPLTPLEASYVAQARDARAPVIACARTDHKGRVASYVFAFGPAGGPRKAKFSVAELGYSGEVYAFDDFAGHGMLLPPDGEAEFFLPKDGAYWIVVPVGPSGIGFLGDRDKFVSCGRQRVTDLSDDGTLRVQIAFAPGEDRVRLHGYARTKPCVQTCGARLAHMTYEPGPGLFGFDLVVDRSQTAEVTLCCASSRDSSFHFS